MLRCSSSQQAVICRASQCPQDPSQVERAGLRVLHDPSGKQIRLYFLCDDNAASPEAKAYQSLPKLLKACCTLPQSTVEQN